MVTLPQHKDEKVHLGVGILNIRLPTRIFRIYSLNTTSV